MIEEKEIKHIASLARIGIKKKELERYQKELSVVLNYFEKLGDLDTKKIKAKGYITGMRNIFREDSVNDCDEDVKEIIMKNAPQEKDGYFKVKSVF
jgi:aspartyl-tRNA(Asn)/glutamyl-tRNA(Gln) amidotransferase subunit C